MDNDIKSIKFDVFYAIKEASIHKTSTKNLLNFARYIFLCFFYPVKISVRKISAAVYLKPY